MSNLKIATVFSGIGAFEQALKKLKINNEIIFACDNGERELEISYQEIIAYKDKNNLSQEELNQYVKQLYANLKKKNWMKESYFENYDITEDRWYEDIRFIDGTKYKDKVDIFVGGSPCQSFSVIGKRGGLEDARGTLFFDYARLVKEIQPKVFIYENVLGMLNHDKAKTWEKILEIFKSLGYKYSVKTLNSIDYGIPQNRKRIFVVGFKNDSINFNFPDAIGLNGLIASDFFEANVEEKYYLGKKGFEFVTNPKYKNRARINKDIIQTQKANQQFNWNGDFVFVPKNEVNFDSEATSAYLSAWEGKLGYIRKMTPRECLNLMGFCRDFKIVVPDVQMYRQAGNSIVVNVLENIMKEITKYDL